MAEESARARTLVISGSEGNVIANVNVNANVAVAVSVGVASPPQPPLTPSTTVVSPDLSIQSSGNGSNKYYLVYAISSS